MKFQFKIEACSGSARAGLLTTPHGTFRTPAFMPVGTQASVKSLSPDDLKMCGVQIILGGNTYHMMLRPGIEVIQKTGGMHNFMGWHGPMLTDSGGFQVLSLSDKQLKQRSHSHLSESLLQDLIINKNNNLRGLNANISSRDYFESPQIIYSQIRDDGVWFKSHLDGSRHFMTPQRSIQIQKITGADIIMAFDDCTSDSLNKAQAKTSMIRTCRWLERSKKEWLKNKGISETTGKAQALFGIIQGGRYKDLRRQSAQFTVGQNLQGIAMGGQTIGFDMDKTEEVISWVKDILPSGLPVYTMGLGQNPDDLVRAVKMGIDIFDCVAPTRMARNGALYNPDFPKSRLNIANSGFAKDTKPILKDCDCYTCHEGFSRAYMHHLFKTRELLYYRLASIHNIRFMISLCQKIRRSICGQ